MTEWVSRIAGCLRDVQAKHLRAAARALGMRADDVARLAVPEDGRRIFAHQLLERALEQPVYEALGRLKGWLSDEHQRNLVEEVLPSWVEVSAARRLLAASVAESAKPPVLVLNGSVDQTARHYIARATCRAVTGFRYATVGAVVGEAAVEDLLVGYEHGVRSLLKVHPTWSLEGTPPRPGVSFLIVDPGAVPMQVVAEAIGRGHRHHTPHAR